MFFSVVIPTYNRSMFIEKTLSTVLNQSFSDFEIIVVDDGSSDNTDEIVCNIKDKRIRYFKTQNQERAAARNYGTTKALGDYVTFLDSDDLFYDNHLTNAFESLNMFNFPDWFHCRYEFLDSQTQETTPQILLSGNLNKKLIEGNFLSCHAVFIKREVALKNLFNENRALSTLEDWELWLRMAISYKLYYSDKITSALVQHDDRSVLDIDDRKLISKFDLFQSIILSNLNLNNYYKKDLNKFKSSCNSYIALHLALAKKSKNMIASYAIKAILQYPKMVFTRRFFAILKHFI